MPFIGSRVDEPIDCPRCFVRMDKVEAEVPGRRVVMDACPRCDGIWLDKDELGKILGNRRLSDYLTKRIGVKTESPLVCPRCGSLMDHEFAEDVEVDACLNCAGLWLDPGELEELESLAKDGYTGDAALKAEELAEEREADRRRTLLDKFTRALYRR